MHMAIRQTFKIPCLDSEQISRLLEKELSDDEILRISEHLDSCDTCRRRVLASTDTSLEPLNFRLMQERRAVRTPQPADVSISRINAILADYEILREIGRGGMGVVFEAQQLKLNRKVALKVLPALLSAVNPESLVRFRREAELAARLKHTNIIAVFDYGEVDGMPYYAMELVNGPSLSGLLREASDLDVIGAVVEIGRNPDSTTASTGSRDSGHDTPARTGSTTRTNRLYYRQVATWIADVADALQFAHEHNVIHRDIKPSNLLLSNSGRLMISDFGLASNGDCESVTMTRGIVGTARYMSPEQVDPLIGTIGPKSDVYGLGATLYELLAFRPMFPSGNDREVLVDVVKITPPSPRRFNRSIPRELEIICLKSIEKAPKERYASATSMAHDLRRWLLGLPIEARRQRLMGRVLKLARRRKLATGTTLIIAALIGLAGYLYLDSTKWHTTALAEADRADVATIDKTLQSFDTLLREGHSKDGLAMAEAALRRYPKHPKLRAARALFLLRLGRAGEAIDDLNLLVAENPDNADAHRVLTALCRAMGNDAEAEKHARAFESVAGVDTPSHWILRVRSLVEPDNTKRIELLSQILEEDPNNIGCLLDRCWAYGMLEQYSRMLVDAHRAVTLAPGLATCHGYLGKAQFALKDYGHAIRSLGRAIELEPENAGWWIDRSLASQEAGKLDAARFDATQAIAIEPDNARAHSCLGVVKAKLGDPSAGLEDCDTAIRLAPNMFGNYLDRMCIYKSLGLWDKIERDASRAIALAPGKSNGYVWRAIASLNQSSYDRAIDDATAALGLTADNSDALYIRGLSRIRLGHFSDALADFDRCLQLRPRFTTAFECRSEVRWHLGDRLGALADQSRAIELSGASRLPLLNRAIMSAKLGLLDDAIRDFSRVLDDTPNDEATLLARGMVFELKGDFESAIQDYRIVADSTGAGQAHGALWLYFALKEAGRTGEAQAALGRLDQICESNASGGFVSRVVQFIRGANSPTEFIDGGATPGDRAAAYYYVGRVARLNGRLDDAMNSWRKCVEFDRRGILEVDFANAIINVYSGRKD